MDFEGLIGLFALACFCVWYGFKKLRYGGEIKKEQKKEEGSEIFSEMFPDLARSDFGSLNSLAAAFGELTGKK